MPLEISQNSQENVCARVPLLMKLQEKETLEQVFFCEFWEICKNTFSSPFVLKHLCSRNFDKILPKITPLPTFS